MKKELEPVKISDVTWFYINKASIDLVLYVKVDGRNIAFEIRIPKSKLKKAFI